LRELNELRSHAGELPLTFLARVASMWGELAEPEGC